MAGLPQENRPPIETGTPPPSKRPPPLIIDPDREPSWAKRAIAKAGSILSKRRTKRAFEPSTPEEEKPGYLRPDESPIPPDELLASMPIDKPQEFLGWLKTFHNMNYFELGREQGFRMPEPYDYRDVSAENAAKALEAIKKQRAQDPEKMRQILADLSPVKVWILASDPDTTIYTPEEANQINRDRLDEEKKRMEQLEAVKELIKPTPDSVRYVHSTGIEETCQKITQRGLNCHYAGLSGVAVGLSRTDQDYNLREFSARHKGYDFAVVVALPVDNDLAEKSRLARREGARLDYSSMFIEELPDEEKVRMHGAGRDYDYKIPSKYIQGYLDTQTGVFTKNPNFDPEISPVERARIMENLVQ